MKTELKEWTVTIMGEVTVYDATKEGAEQWVADNLSSFNIDIQAEDNDDYIKCACLDPKCTQRIPKNGNE